MEWIMKILLVGDINGVFLSQLSDQLLQKGIRVASFDSGNLIYKNFNGVSACLANNYLLKILLKIRKLRALATIYLIRNWIEKNYKFLLEFDVINFHFMDCVKRWMMRSMMQKDATLKNKIMVTIWGSDFYCANTKKIKADIFCYKKANVISFTNEKTIESFRERYKEIGVENKCRIAHFGLLPIEEIRLLKRENLKILLQSVAGYVLDTNKIKVVIGYSAAKGHQHIRIIQQLQKLPKDVLDRILFVFPLGYGGTVSYKNKIKKFLSAVSVHYRILPNMLSYREVAKLRIFTDIMLNFPLTDQFSGSMIETLFAGNIVITGEWLPYDVLLEKGVFLERINNLSGLNVKLLYVINNLSLLKDECRKNPEILLPFVSWESNIANWISIYQSMCGCECNE